MQANEDLAPEYLAFCEAVYKDALVIARHAREGRSSEADEAATQLAQAALTNIQTLLSAQEQEVFNDNDLAARVVEAWKANQREQEN